MSNKLFYGDNLVVMAEHVADASVDLIYLDPPFNSKKSYNVLFKTDASEDAPAQIHAFEDTWTWDPHTAAAYDDLVATAPTKVADAVEAMRRLLGENDVMAYLVMMAQRLLGMHRTLKVTGSVFLHCDPTASHYLKLILDAIFGPTNFVNEIVWGYDTGGRAKQHFPRKHDIIFWYAKNKAQKYFNYDAVALQRDFSTMHETVLVDEDGRKYQRNMKNGKEYRYYFDKGVLPNDYWTDIPALNPAARERLGYPTQKPVALLERIINAACPPDGTVLDPFCGCGTTVDAAQRLGRSWIGIDIAYIAIDLIQKRLLHSYGSQITDTYTVLGIPTDLDGARALFKQSPLDFERWAVSLVGAQPNDRQVGDRGIDGQARFPLGGGSLGRVLVSVKGGATVAPTFVRDLDGTLTAQGGQIGIFVTLASATRGVTDAINHGGNYTHPGDGRIYPRLQHLTVEELLAGRRPNLPPTQLPYFPATPANQKPDALF